jgi:hypothetical protein
MNKYKTQTMSHKEINNNNEIYKKWQYKKGHLVFVPSIFTFMKYTYDVLKCN